MNPGSEPERDDTGLPPVDVEIPDDARELDRDVQAYYREVRAERRRSRSFRLRRSLGREGVVLPLLACCLIFALITGTLLTVFSASSISQEPGAGGAGPVLHAGEPLPATPIVIAGHKESLQGLRPAALLLVPANCNCAATLDAVLTELGGSVPVVVVTSPGVPNSELATAEGDGAEVATDPSGNLRRIYAHAGLTAVLVEPDGLVQYADQLRLDDNMGYLLQAVGG